MDIRKWLDETVLPQQPPSPTEVPLVRPEEPERTPWKQQKRRHSTTDSSFLDPPPRRRKASTGQIEENQNESTDSDAPHPTNSGSSSSSQPYARKPRRKTRPERYEPTSKHSKAPGTQGGRHRELSSTKTKRKTRRKKDVKQGSLAQSFHAQNVPKDRLTLKPQGKPGLFNKGRASSAVKGRGLPDLVFSEMKFLQSQGAQAEPDPPMEVPKKKRKKDRSHATEAESSAYFAAVRPALAEKDVNTQAKEGSHRKKLREIDRDEQQQPAPVVDDAIPTVESTDNASYLGFGSRGPRHESTSCISWSESIQAPSDIPAHPRKGSTTNAGQLDSVHEEQTQGVSFSGKPLHSHAAAPPSVIRKLPDRCGGRIQVSSLAPANERLSRSHSLPQHTSSPRRHSLVDRAAKHRTFSSTMSPLSMPPFIPQHGNAQHGSYQSAQVDAAVISTGTPIFSQQHDAAPLEDSTRRRKTNTPTADEIDPQTLSGHERLILDCNTKFNEMRRTEVTMNVDPALPTIPIRGGARALYASYPTIQRTPTVRFAGLDELRQPRMLNFSGSGLYEKQERRQSYTHQEALPYLDEGELLEEAEEDDHDGQNCGEQEGPISYGADFTEILGGLQAAHGVEYMHDTDLPSTVAAMPRFWRPYKLY